MAKLKEDQNLWYINKAWYNSTAPVTSGSFVIADYIYNKDYANLEVAEAEDEWFKKLVIAAIVLIDDMILSSRVKNMSLRDSETGEIVQRGFDTLPSSHQTLLKNIVAYQIEKWVVSGYVELEAEINVSLGGAHNVVMGKSELNKAMDLLSKKGKRLLLTSGLRDFIFSYSFEEKKPQLTALSPSSTFIEGLDENGNVVDEAYAVSNLYWEDKQNKCIVLDDGTSTTVEATLNFMFSDYATNSDLVSLEGNVVDIDGFLNDNFKITASGKLNILKPLTADIVYINKELVDYAQWTDVANVWENSVYYDEILNERLIVAEGKIEKLFGSPQNIWTGEKESTPDYLNDEFDIVQWDWPIIDFSPTQGINYFLTIDVNGLVISGIPFQLNSFIKFSDGEHIFDTTVIDDIIYLKAFSLLEVDYKIIGIKSSLGGTTLAIGSVLGIQNDELFQNVNLTLPMLDFSTTESSELDPRRFSTQSYVQTKLLSFGNSLDNRIEEIEAKTSNLNEFGKVINEPTDDKDIATKNYVDNLGKIFTLNSSTPTNIVSAFVYPRQYTIQLISSDTEYPTILLHEHDNGHYIYRNGEVTTISSGDDGAFILRTDSSVVGVDNVVISFMHLNRIQIHSDGLAPTLVNQTNPYRYEYVINGINELNLITRTGNLTIVVKEI